MKTIQTAGKGGTGKSVLLASLLTDHLLQQTKKRVLVVDADPHQSLTQLLSLRYGFQKPISLGELKRSHRSGLNSGVGLENVRRDELAEMLVGRALVRVPNASLLVMGPNTLPGCQCVVNTLLDQALEALQEQFDLVVIDNEAGIEHIGRHHQRAIDLLLLLTTPQNLDMDVAGRILEHASQVGREIRHSILVINKVRSGNGAGKKVDSLSRIDLVTTLPYSAGLEGNGRPDAYWHAAVWNVFNHVRAQLENVNVNGLSDTRDHL